MFQAQAVTVASDEDGLGEVIPAKVVQIFAFFVSELELGGLESLGVVLNFGTEEEVVGDLSVPGVLDELVSRDFGHEVERTPEANWAGLWKTKFEGGGVIPRSVGGLEVGGVLRLEGKVVVVPIGRLGLSLEQESTIS